MSDAPLSAYAMHALKRKSIGVSPKSKKIKQKHTPANTNVPQQKNVKGVQKKINHVSHINGQKAMCKENTVTSKKFGPSIVVKKKKPICKLKNKKVSNKEGIALKQSKVTTKLPEVKKTETVKLRIKHTKKKPKLNSNKPQNVNQQSIAIPRLPLDCNSVNNDSDENPLVTSRSMFEWLIHPLKIEDFFQQNWEKTPVHIKRGRPSYYKFLISTPLLDKILRDFHILFFKNIDITSYTNGVRETHNPPGRALPSVVWDYYMNGCSVRMLNPQTYIPKLHALNATLQEFFGCFVGANSYLTPPNTQGFAPHYDDIEAFLLQIEGKKRWRLYKPRNENEYLSRYSSINFDQSEIGEPILDTIVNAGDLLYFPRGTIHQGETFDDTHSLHLTISVYQRNSWGDFLVKLLPEALKTAIENDSEFREGLPLDYLRHCGFVHSEDRSGVRESFEDKIKTLCKKLIKYIDTDKAADMMAKGHIHDFLPPALSDIEKECSVMQDGEVMTANGVVQNRVEIEPDTRIRLLRSHCVRLIEEEGTFKIYYSCDNSKEYHEYELQFLEVGKEFVPAVQEIILRYPEFIRVEDLPIDGEDNKIQIVKDLWEKCIVITDQPLCVVE